MTAKIGFIGAGQMASAMIKGILEKGLYAADDVVACAPSASTRGRVSAEHGIRMFETAAEVAEETDFLVLAVKPKQIPGVFAENGLKIGAEHLIMSIAAGVTIASLEAYVPDSKIVRVMPNHCCMVLEGAAGYSRGTKADDDDVNKVKAVLEATGLAFEVKESDLDAVTGLAGSSPAYMYMIIDAMADGGVLCGLPRDMSIRLAAQSMLGAAKTVLETGKHPDVLKDGVCSPGGTTIEGVRTLEDLGARSAFIAAVQAGVEKSKEMSAGR
jgi:pyrroline-5-carboxylate reductase